MLFLVTVFVIAIESKLEHEVKEGTFLWLLTHAARLLPKAHNYLQG